MVELFAYAVDTARERIIRGGRFGLGARPLLQKTAQTTNQQTQCHEICPIAAATYM